MFSIRNYNVCIVGFGNVGRALVQLLQSKRRILEEQYGIGFRITGIASRRLGWIARAEGLDPEMLLNESTVCVLRPSAANFEEWLSQTKADLLFEATSLNRHDGQPAIDHIRAALKGGAHAITANKGPVVFAYESLRMLATAKKKAFLFESAAMDGVPIFSLFRECLPATHVLGFRGILNSTTNVVLAGMESGLGLNEALAKAQQMGIAESDPSDDLQGWDAAVKVAALINVIMRYPIDLSAIKREGIISISPEKARAARESGKPFKMVCRARRQGKEVRAAVKLEQLPFSDPLAWIDGASSCVEFELDILPGLVITERNPSLETTAYGMLADFIRAVSLDNTK